MARGKEAAQAANRRAETAQQELHELRQQFATFREKAKQREDELLAELQKTKNRLVSEVGALAGNAVRHAEMRVEQVRAEEREAARRRVIAGFEVAQQQHQRGETSPAAMSRVADAFGVELRDLPGELGAEPGDPRAIRRMRNSHLRKGESVADQTKGRYIRTGAELVSEAQKLKDEIGSGSIRG